MTRIDFDTFRKNGPWVRQGDVDRAWRRWTASVRSEDDLRAIHEAKRNYAEEVELTLRLKMAKGATLKEARHWIQHFSTWMKCWSENWVSESRCEAIEDEEPQNGHHRCDVCPTPHEWAEAGEPLNWVQQRRMACPEARDAMRKAISSGLQRVAAGKGM